MICLHCGDCCTRFSIDEINKPAGERCQYLTDENMCSIYQERPDVCRKHDYPFDICPIGIQKNPNGYQEVLKLLRERDEKKKADRVQNAFEREIDYDRSKNT